MWAERSFGFMVSETSLARAPQIPGSSTKCILNNDKIFYISLKVPFESMLGLSYKLTKLSPVVRELLC